ncbi:MAG: MBL fold metallo-hydrolase [Treponemataceae bacterium]|nr:MBL fold metallo-hydrolase [Treponemataceae bacterium]
MKATVLVDSTRAGNLKAEWGLSILVEYNEKKILIDTGASSNFLKNAQMCGISIKDVDAGILTHAHYDHANGLNAFFKENSTAKFYLQKACKENCYSSRKFYNRYIGIKKGTLEKYKDRFEFIENTYKLIDGVTLVPHNTEQNIAPKSEKIENLSTEHPDIESSTQIKPFGHITGTLLVKNNDAWQLDLFDHEQTVVFETSKGLIVFTSCAHSGVINMIQEIKNAFPYKTIYALAGGFHLHRKSDNDIAQIAWALAQTEIKQIYTGHCTGTRAFEILKKYLGSRLFQLHTGLIMQF